ncbi:MAG TPA: hypothetical protein PLY87_19830 [Planctomycetaceae bacterium]|nr:hypothetical protein [Planctomycetaceae bacterium]HQZ67354.1 hypothetical protein [Planctomycetaceae bacterium]
MTEPSVEERLARIEEELKEIKTRLDRPTKENWISRMRGQFRDDPVFDEIVRLGKELRDAELPPDDNNDSE